MGPQTSQLYTVPVLREQGKSNLTSSKTFKALVLF